MNSSQLKNRIVIGSANFTQRYGIDPIKINSYEIKKILNLAKKNNIYKIDTANAYIKDKNIFKNINKNFRFSSKIIPDYRWRSLDFCQKQLEKHLEKLNNNKIQVLLIHNHEVLSTKDGKIIFKNLKYLKNKNFFQKIGLSIYDTKCLNYMTSNFELDVVQCPYNVLDKRIINSGWFDKLKKIGIKIQIRSIFLQGLLVNKSIYKKKNFNKWEKKISNWFTFLENNNISPINYCLSDLMTYDFDEIVIGINNFDSLKEIINFKRINKGKIINFESRDLKLIDPRKWK